VPLQVLDLELQQTDLLVNRSRRPRHPYLLTPTELLVSFRGIKRLDVAEGRRHPA